MSKAAKGLVTKLKVKGRRNDEKSNTGTVSRVAIPKPLAIYNKRFAADKARSQVGLLLGHQAIKSTFLPPNSRMISSILSPRRSVVSGNENEM